MLKIIWIIIFTTTFALALIFYHGNNDLFNILLGAFFAGVPAIVVLLLQELFNDYRAKKLRIGVLNSAIYEIENNEYEIFRLFEIKQDYKLKRRSRTFNGPLLSLVQLKNLESHFDIFSFNDVCVEKFHYFKDKIFEFTSFPPFGPNVNREIYWEDAKPMIEFLFEFKYFLRGAIKSNGNFEIKDVNFYLNKGQLIFNKKYTALKFEE